MFDSFYSTDSSREKLKGDHIQWVVGLYIISSKGFAPGPLRLPLIHTYTSNFPPPSHSHKLSSPQLSQDYILAGVLDWGSMSATLMSKLSMSVSLT